MAEETVTRETLELDGVPLSYLCAGEGPPILLLHGNYWSRVWLPVLPRLAREHAAFALDFPGFGRSGGRLEAREASVPPLADLVLQVTNALRIENFGVAGHNIDCDVAQRLAAFGDNRVGKLALVNSVLYDSCPVPRWRVSATRRSRGARHPRSSSRPAANLCASRPRATCHPTRRKSTSAVARRRPRPLLGEARRRHRSSLHAGACGAAAGVWPAHTAPLGGRGRVPADKIRQAFRGGDPTGAPHYDTRSASHPDGGRPGALRG